MVVDALATNTDADRIFHALADATRRDIVRRTLISQASVSELAASYSMSFAAVQKHVAVLEGARLVSKHPRGRERMVRAEPQQIAYARTLLTALEQMWHARFSQLDAVLGAAPETPGTTTESTYPQE